MKRMLLIASVLVVLVVAFASAEVLSRNAVGFVKVCVPNGGYFMGTVPFNDYGSTEPRTVGEIFGDQLTGTDGIIIGSDYISKYDADDQTYRLFWKAKNAGSPEWRDTINPTIATTNKLSPGDAFFIQSNQSSNQCVFLMGEVPDSFTLPTGTGTVNIIQGFNQVAYPFPVEMALTNASFASDVVPGLFGDQISRWDSDAGSYIVYFFDDGSFGANGWSIIGQFGTVVTDRLSMAEGMFYNRNSGTPIVWEEKKPYTWP